MGGQKSESTSYVTHVIVFLAPYGIHVCFCLRFGRP